VTSYYNSSKQELYSGQESQYGRTYWQCGNYSETRIDVLD